MNNDAKLRSISDADHEWLVELHNDPVVLHNLNDPSPITMDHHLNWWAAVRDNHKQKHFIFTLGEERIGLVKITSIDSGNSNCMLGGDIHHDHRGKGYAKKMWSLMLDFAFFKLGLDRVGLTTAEFNAVGRHVYSSVGFKEEGRQIQALYRDGKFHDIICMYMLRSDWVK